MDLNPLERNLEAYLRRACDRRNWLVMKAGQNGWPDDVVITENGAQGWVELKRRTGVVSPKQALMVETLLLRFVLVRIARSEAQIEQFLAELEVLDLAMKFRRLKVD